MTYLLQKNQTKNGGSVYCVAMADFAVTVAGGNKVATIVGCKFTVLANNIVEAFYRDAAGIRYDLPLSTLTVAANAVTFTDKTANFSATDVVEIYVLGTQKESDPTSNLRRSAEMNPLDTKFSPPTSLVDTTNLAAGTVYYPASTGGSMDNFKDISFTGKIIDGGDGDVTLTFEATNDEDTSPTGDWIDITKIGLLNDNTSGNASITVANGTVTFAIKFDNLNYSSYRWKCITTGASTNTVIIKERKKAL